MTFKDREQAGRLLGEHLERYRADNPIVLGLTRGGVPVAYEVARFLGAELDFLVVRKIGAPGSPEYAIGAIAEGGTVYLRRDALLEIGLRDDAFAELAEAEAEELARRVRLYRGDRPMPDLAGRTVIVVDDGVATGATAHAAGRAARSRRAARVVLAAPVIAAASEAELRLDFDQVIAVRFPEAFFAVSQWYARFPQVSDDEVLDIVRRSRAETPEREGGARREAASVAPEDDPPPFEPYEEILTIPFEGGELHADVVLPPEARGIVVFVHGSGSTRRSPRNRFVARVMQQAGFATVLFDLLTPAEAAEDEVTADLRFDIELLTGRVSAATRCLTALPRTRGLRLGYFGASTGAAAALAAAAAFPDEVGAVVSRGGRPDLVAPDVLRKVRAPALLVVGSRDETVLRFNQSVLAHLRAAELAVVPGATHLFEEPGTLDAVARLAARWFERHLAQGVAAPHTNVMH